MRAIEILFVVLVATMAIPMRCSEEPNEVVGLRETIVMSGLNHVISQILPVVLREAKTVPIPDVHGESHTPLGKFTYDITGVHIPVLEDHSFVVHTLPNHGLKIDIQGLTVRVHGHWHFKQHKFPHVSGKGTFEVKTAGSMVDVKVGIGMAGGKPTVHCDQATVNLHHFDIKVHGGWAWLLNVMKDIFHNKIRHVVQTQLDKEIQKVINSQGQKALQKLNLIVKVDPTAEMDFSLTQNPHFGNDYFSVPEKGEFYRIGQHEEAPFPAVPLPDLAGAGHFRIMASDFVPNSAGHVYWKAGKLQHLLTEAEVPKECPIQLNTAFFKKDVPALYAKYPDMKIRVEIAATKAPETKITAAQVGTSWEGDLHVLVVTGGETVKVATIGMELATAGKAWMQVHTFHSSVSFLSFKVKVKESIIGPMDLPALNWVFEYLCTKGIVPFLNALMAKGIEVPVIQGFHFVNPSITFQNGFLVVGTDLDYRP